MRGEKQFAEVVGLIKEAQGRAFGAINVELINTYWQVGEYIHERIAQAVWGEKTVEDLARFIESKHPDIKGFNRSALYRMRQFYEAYRHSEIVAALPRQLALMDVRSTILATISWTNHQIILARSKSAEEREFYVRLSSRERYGSRELERQISSGVYERVMLGNEKLPLLVKRGRADISNAFKSDYVLEFLNLPKQYSEGDLQRALISQMKKFILELGRDFLFMGEEYRLQVGNSDFKADLLFFHRGLQSLVLFELKTDKFRPEYLGQLSFYLEALDRDVKKEHENPSIGILLCKDQDEEVVKYAMNRSLSPAMVAAYQMQLPDRRVLKEKLREVFENRS
jgi:predicted nuclease of restriction endonuclease-like (RecB) superfamily